MKAAAKSAAPVFERAARLPNPRPSRWAVCAQEAPASSVRAPQATGRLPLKPDSLNPPERTQRGLLCLSRPKNDTCAAEKKVKVLGFPAGSALCKKEM